MKERVRKQREEKANKPRVEVPESLLEVNKSMTDDEILIDKGGVRVVKRLIDHESSAVLEYTH